MINIPMLNAPFLSDTIKHQGRAYLSRLPQQKLADVMAYLKSCVVYPGCHVTYSATGAPGPWDDHLEADVVSWHMHDVLRAPHLLEHALQYIDVAAQFLGVEPPLLYSVNAFCTRPVVHVRPDIQDWHRDMDDTMFLPMFVYLTETDERTGQRLRGPQGEVCITGPAGTTFFSNTMLEHLGGRPVAEDRIIFWARWGVSDPPAAYQWDKLTPIDKAQLGSRYPTDARLQSSIRLVAS